MIPVRAAAQPQKHSHEHHDKAHAPASNDFTAALQVASATQATAAPDAPLQAPLEITTVVAHQPKTTTFAPTVAAKAAPKKEAATASTASRAPASQLPLPVPAPQVAALPARTPLNNAHVSDAPAGRVHQNPRAVNSVHSNVPPGPVNGVHLAQVQPQDAKNQVNGVRPDDEEVSSVHLEEPGPRHPAQRLVNGVHLPAAAANGVHFSDAPVNSVHPIAARGAAETPAPKSAQAAAKPAEKAEADAPKPAKILAPEAKTDATKPAVEADAPLAKAAEKAHATPEPTTFQTSLIAHFVPPRASESAAPASPLQPQSAPDLDALAWDPTLRVDLKEHEARVSLDAGGGVSLHLNVQNGVANVRAEGNAAPLLAANVPELRSALASQGLELGSFDTSGRKNEEHEQADADSPTPVTAAGTPAAKAPQRRPQAGRLEVEA